MLSAGPSNTPDVSPIAKGLSVEKEKVKSLITFKELNWKPTEKFN